YVLRHNPDLLIIGGISQRGDIEAIRSVIHQCRAKLPELEVLLLSPTFGGPPGPKGPSPEYLAYQAALPKLAAEEKCGYFDMTTPWKAYIDNSGYALDSFKRDVVHANDRGKQILGRLMRAFFAP
ncbi:MAG TPA: SGNH/GDSL hydrolase family protein, partial [Luteolibacter sp.]|nr:SGNH/GDSL hydrolase family protein [Luteolibacter sp.]